MSKLGLESFDTTNTTASKSLWAKKRFGYTSLTLSKQTDRDQKEKKKQQKKQPSNFSHLTMKSERYTRQPECKEEDKVR